MSNNILLANNSKVNSVDYNLIDTYQKYFSYLSSIFKLITKLLYHPVRTNENEFNVITN